MKTNKWLFLILPLLFFSIVACISCTGIQPVELKKVESIKILQSSGQGIDLEIDVVLHNPNFFKCTISEGDLNIILNKVDLGNAKLLNQVKLPAKSELSQKFQVHVGVSTALLGGFASFFSILKRNSADIQLKGTIKAKAFGISKVFPVDETTSIPFSL